MKAPQIAAIALFGLASAAGLNAKSATPVEAIAEGVNEYSFAFNQQIVHGKIFYNLIPETVSTPTRNTASTNYQQSGEMGTLDEANPTFSRIVVNAPTAGTYSYGISTYDATSNLAMRVYVNSVTEYSNVNLSNTTWWNKTGLQYSEFDVELEQGLNYIIVQWNSWGNLVTFTLPEELTLVDYGSDEEGTYSGTDIKFAETYIDDPLVSLADTSSSLPYQELRYDASEEYEGAAYVEITPMDTTNSLDLTISSETAGTGMSLEVKVMETGKSFVHTFDIEEAGVETVVNIPSYQLEAAGFFDNATSTIRVSNPVSGQKIRLTKVEESLSITDDPLAEYKTIAGDELKSSVKVNGRSLDLEGGIALDWSGSGIEFILNGGGDVIADFSNEGSNASNTRFVVEIDGQDPVYVYPSAVTYIAEGLEEGTHTIRLTKTSEAHGNLYQLNSLRIDKDAIISKATDRDTKFLFIGASIVCGNQLSEEDGEDYFQAWANLVSRAHDADAQVVARSGSGLVLGENPLNTVFDYTSYYRDEATLYDKSSYEPDAIFINAGNNDLGFVEKDSYSGPHAGTKEEKLQTLLTGTEEFISGLRELYPSSKIVYLWGVGTNHGAEYGEILKETVLGLNDPALSFVNLDGQDAEGNPITGMTIQGLSGHPSIYQCDQIAEKVSEAYSGLAGIEDPYIRRFDFETFEAENYIAGDSTGHITVEEDNKAENWSGGKYAVSLSNNGISDVSDILPRATNIDHLAIPYFAKVAGTYEIQVGLATNSTTSFGYAIDDGAFALVENVNSGDWCGGHGFYVSLKVNLTRGEHTIYISAPLTNWVNYDYVNLLYADDASESLDAARGFANAFMAESGEICVDSAISNNFPESKWQEFAGEYGALDQTAKDIICSYDEFASLRERYTFIAEKYGYEEFMSDSNGDYLPVLRALADPNAGVNASYLAPVTAIGALIAGGGIAAFAVSKRRKGEKK